MALNTKRKRVEPAVPRKARRVEEEADTDDASTPGEEEGSEDDEEWGGVSAQRPQQQQGGVEESGGKPNKPPTGEELRVIKDAADLFRSSSFKLQIDALLPNVRPKESRTPPLDRFLLALHTFLMEIPSIPLQHPLEAARKMLKKGIAVPYTLPLPTEETNWKVGYTSPSDIVLVGSWANKISVKPKDGLRYGVDLAVEMPDDLLQEKDYLNGRFFQKRAFYLAAIAAAIKSSKKMNVELFYESPSGNPRLTNLVLIPQKDGSPTDFTKLNAKIVIIPTVSNSCPIPITRLSPNHANLRLSSSSDTQPRHLASPSYNNALLYAFSPRAHLLATHTLKQESPAFSDAVALLRVWANQRGFCESSEGKMGVRGFEGMGGWWVGVLSMIVLGEEEGEQRQGLGAMRRRKALGRGLSSYQMFKAVLDFLARFESEKDAVFVKSPNGHRFPLNEYDVQRGPVFVDSTSLVNLLEGVPRGSLRLLRYEAAKTMEMLNQTTMSGNTFADVFLKEHRDLPTKFDCILRVNLSNAKPRTSSLEDTIDKGSPFNSLLLSVDTLLHHGLGDRIKAATILNPSTPPRPINQALPPNPDVIYIGLLYHPQHAFRLVDYGPAADEQDQDAINAFKEFWGDKAELRRFKDGRILESVVWDVKTADERAHIPAMVVRYILERHFGINGINAVQSWQSGFDAVLRLPESISSVYLNGGLPVGFKNALAAFDGIVKAIKELDDELPLATLNVSPISEALRYTSVFTPVPLPGSITGLLPPNARYLPYFEFIVEFEKSSKWPDDLKAIQKIKLAFFERVAEALMKSVPGLRARVVVGGGIQDSLVLDCSFLEIVTVEGWAFAARIWNQREATLLDRAIAGQDSAYLPHVKSQQKNKQNRGKEYQDALFAKEVYTRRFVHAPRHHRAIAALCHRYSAYAGTVRLVKRWLAAHWLLGGGHVAEEAVEVVCALVFVGADGRYAGYDVDSEQSVNQPVPVTKERGFAVVIEFLKEWKWEEGVFVPLYGQLDAAGAGGTAVEGNDENGEAVGAKVGSNAGEGQKQVKASSGSAWTISTEFDKEGKMWTAKGPDVVVAHRIKALANATWEYLQRIEQGNLNVQALFIHPTDDYDFVVHLNPSVLPRYAQNVSADMTILSKREKYANRKLGDQDAVIRPGFDPARMLFDDLQRIYADTFKLFYDTCGGDRFGGVWDPSVKQPRPFRVLGGFSSEPLSNENGKGKDNKDLVCLNQNAIISEIERIGSGLVNKIVVRT